VYRDQEDRACMTQGWDTVPVPHSSGGLARQIVDRQIYWEFFRANSMVKLLGYHECKVIQIGTGSW
jgi:hypothetical protein